MSSVCTRSIEAVAKANGDGHRWYQLCWPRSADVRLLILSRANAAGFTALVFMVDSSTIGWRPSDLDTALLPPCGRRRRAGRQVGSGIHAAPEERPAFPLDMDAFRKFLAEGDEEAALTMTLCNGWLRETTSSGFRMWEDLAFLREN